MRSATRRRQPTDCSVSAAYDALEKGDQTFASMVQQIALSETLSIRVVAK